VLALRNALGRVICDAALKDQPLGRLTPAGLPVSYGRGEFRGYDDLVYEHVNWNGSYGVSDELLVLF
jgi:hypothetical protein